MKVGTKVTFSSKLKAKMKVAVVMIVMGLIGLSAGQVQLASIDLNFHNP